ncbi:DgyrCDS14750 [Dimorphilus gyrociliatus]|uniref:DgyrCDS14750 n=1 Tax=Dimorphilus gyrociliatus TaxID=2664684 RepID=A0A7I8WEX9_9ANNE|nr:DgyrCDS14750 [Dimorphilus gyrociliatus]
MTELTKKKDWASACNSENSCSPEYIKIIFKQQYDIVQICIEQRLARAPLLTKKVRIDYSNGRNSTHQLNDKIYQKCFLLPREVGKGNEWIKVTTIKGYGSAKRGLGSVMAYAYSENSHCNIPNYNIDDCKKALDYDSSLSHDADWSAPCQKSDCYADVYELTFPSGVKPKIICLAGREVGGVTLVTEMKVEWSSSFQQTFQFPTSRLRRCFEYSSNFVETGLKLWSTKFHDTNGHHMGYAYIQVYIETIPQKDFDIETNDELIYHFPPSYTSSIIELNFGVQIVKNSDSKSHAFIINFLNKTGNSKLKITMDIGNDIDNTRKTTFIIEDRIVNEITTQNNSNHLLSLDSWTDFSVVFSKNYIQFGRLKLNVSEIIYKINHSFVDKVTTLGVNNKEGSKFSKFRVNNYKFGLFNLDINALYLADCKKPTLNNLNDFNILTCTAIDTIPYTVGITKHNNFGRIKQFAEVVLKHTVEAKQLINIYFLLTKTGSKNSKVCPLSNVTPLNGQESLWTYKYDCTQNEELVGKMVINILPSHSSPLVEICEVYL